MSHAHCSIWKNTITLWQIHNCAYKLLRSMCLRFFGFFLQGAIMPIPQPNKTCICRSTESPRQVRFCVECGKRHRNLMSDVFIPSILEKRPKYLWGPSEMWYSVPDHPIPIQSCFHNIYHKLSVTNSKENMLVYTIIHTQISDALYMLMHHAAVPPSATSSSTGHVTNED
jgi:hypothetical protein